MTLGDFISECIEPTGPEKVGIEKLSASNCEMIELEKHNKDSKADSSPT